MLGSWHMLCRSLLSLVAEGLLRPCRAGVRPPPGLRAPLGLLAGLCVPGPGFPSTPAAAAPTVPGEMAPWVQMAMRRSAASSWVRGSGWVCESCSNHGSSRFSTAKSLDCSCGGERSGDICPHQHQAGLVPAPGCGAEQEKVLI